MPFDPEGEIGLVGAGAMGFPIMRHMIGAGFTVACCDLDADRRAQAEALGARSTATVKDLGSCSVVLVLVPTDEDVQAVAEQYAEVARTGSCLVICSSVRTETCREVGASLAARGVRVVDAPLTGGVRGAESGEINLLVGGEPDEVADLAPVLAPWTSHVHRLGPLGSGQVGKTVNNLIHWSQIVAIAEALSLGGALGVPPSVMRTALMDGSTDSRTLRELELMRFTWFEKDIDNAVKMAATIDRTLPLAPTVQRLMRGVDVPKMADLLTDRAVIELPDPA